MPCGCRASRNVPGPPQLQRRWRSLLQVRLQQRQYETNRANENAPSHRAFVGRAEIGAAWPKRSAEHRDYLSVKLDDPSFNAPIYANLFDDEEGEGYSLIWSRPNGRRSD